jgi:hypothetical protein
MPEIAVQDPGIAFPGWDRLQADLSAAADSGDEIKLTAVEVLVVLGEHQRLRRRLDRATRLLRQVLAGGDCHGSQQGYAPCEFRGVDGFLAGVPKRRWWRRS